MATTPDAQSETTSERPVIFGEVLFDCFAGGPEVLGGAPFNVAWHLQGFGQQPLLISRVGEDAHGDALLAQMRSWGMDTRGVQRDPAHPTGRVEIVQDGSRHSFDILPDQAYDHIDADTACELLLGVNVALLYIGSLARRHPVSCQAMEALQAQGHPIFVDINLRAPWWEEAGVQALLRQARWFKLNDEELRQLAPAAAAAGETEAARALLEQNGLELLILTRGAAGALLLSRDAQVEGRPPELERLVDTVGAGDAFSAVTLLGLLRGWTLEQILERALTFAARISEQRGATAADPALYQHYREHWGL
ncbi:MAG TPA: carbohydrate kinase [Thiohalobacter sp.]|nr:carbohydrate kinase [Thiohalobacter sp.]